MPKPAFELIHNPNETTFRVRGTTINVLINHGHFLGNQKTSATGITTEPLDWVIKLHGKSEQNFNDALLQLNTPSFRAEVDRRVLDGLEKGDAIELINDSAKSLINQKLSEHQIGTYTGKFAIRRAGSLKNATVVISEHFAFKDNAQQRVDINSLSKTGSGDGKPTRHYEHFSL